HHRAAPAHRTHLAAPLAERFSEVPMHATLTQSCQPTTALITILQQLQAVVGCLRDEQYAMNPVGVVNSSIGGHVRHCLDHVRALLSAIDTSSLDYDRRDRGTQIEDAPAAA